MISVLIKYWLAVVWALIILTLCGINGNSLPVISFDFGIDKFIHFGLFGILSYLIIYPSGKPFYQTGFSVVNRAFVLSSLYGVLIEILQGTVFANRTFDYADMLADSIGALLLYPFVFIVNNRIKSKQN